MTDTTKRKRNANTPGRMYDKIRAQRDRAGAKLDEAIARLRGTHRLRFQSYVVAQLEQCSDPDELRGMLDRLAEKEAARTPGDPFWQIRDLLSFVGHLAKATPTDLPAATPATSALAADEPPGDPRPVPDEVPENLRHELSDERKKIAGMK